MKRYAVEVVRTVVEEATLLIDANDAEEAHREAKKLANLPHQPSYIIWEICDVKGDAAVISVKQTRRATKVQAL